MRSHQFDNLALVAEAKNTIRRNSGVGNVYTCLHAKFEGFQFHAARKYVNLTKEGRQEDFFADKEYKEEDKVLPFSQRPLVVEHRVGGVEF